ncbi:hypothetical protein F3J23_17095 [Chryseobacterium sp. Tr-659]|uniref:DUF7825 domain-containing protein n=1 Tax=Chryseobacterium sp. Tr-659 TaxID=2608340 RepID=UPI0014203B1A|nr:DUF6493 family protein [Chryseobacterium sp. Tr-659]NIF07142.1 hypothetical protein [Chryseobacterium sp. Tr-659]
MLIDEGFNTIYLNYATRETIPFLKKLTPRDKKEVVVLLKKRINKKWRRNTIFVLAASACCKTQNEYERMSPGYYYVRADSADRLFASYIFESIGKFYSFFNYLLNFYHSVYINNLIRILSTAPSFSGFALTEKYNKILLRFVFQCDMINKVTFLYAWIKLGLSFQSVRYLFMSRRLFNKNKTFYGITFEVLINKAVSEDFEDGKQGMIIGKKNSFGWAPVQRFITGISFRINVITHYNIAYRKLLIPILSAVEKRFFNLKKLLELYDELLNLNRALPGKTVLGLLKEWKKENNLKKIIHQIKST